MAKAIATNKIYLMSNKVELLINMGLTTFGFSQIIVLQQEIYELRPPT